MRRQTLDRLLSMILPTLLTPDVEHPNALNWLTEKISEQTLFKTSLCWVYVENECNVLKGFLLNLTHSSVLFQNAMAFMLQAIHQLCCITELFCFDYHFNCNNY